MMSTIRHERSTQPQRSVTESEYVAITTLDKCKHGDVVTIRFFNTEIVTGTFIEVGAREGGIGPRSGRPRDGIGWSPAVVQGRDG